MLCLHCQPIRVTYFSIEVFRYFKISRHLSRFFFPHPVHYILAQVILYILWTLVISYNRKFQVCVPIFDYFFDKKMFWFGTYLNLAHILALWIGNKYYKYRKYCRFWGKKTILYVLVWTATWYHIFTRGALHRS